MARRIQLPAAFPPPCPPGASPGPLFGPPGLPLDPFWVPLDPFWVPLGIPWIPFGTPWTPLGLPWAPPGLPLDPIGAQDEKRDQQVGSLAARLCQNLIIYNILLGPNFMQAIQLITSNGLKELP